MRLVVVSLVAMCACSSGCALICDATSLMVFKARESIEDCHENVRNHKWAEEAWVHVKAGTPGVPFSKDYAQGFKDGFAYFLFRGGNGEPPPLPPNSYRKVAYQTPQGYQAIEDWFAGYRHGEELLARIEELLRDRGLAPVDLGGLVVGTGPGAFTGLRVGIATAKGKKAHDKRASLKEKEDKRSVQRALDE
jgi:hypothetical protein